ncbi:hypothetical protein F3N42_08170 [Marinihelvus fidelis]|uniref:SatD family (SatD) n=1 Tax=Marinihelvus fidelis TaxID=2613842 RepID=A0A5N0T8D3_9GAMM|nr:SatD family protein [Marinihelvus fidelis]KAA9131293.1 hypothetical protein F3N42_08170 [Marinihelvus fidelis]
MGYFAIIGDLDASRELDQRAAVQRQLTAAVDRLNQSDRRATTALRLTAGDEIQGLSTDPVYTLDVLLALSEAATPGWFSWGLGYGGLATDIVDDIAMMDGPCFHQARTALAAAKHRDTWLEARGIDDEVAVPLTALMNLAGAIRADWTERQSTYVAAARGRRQSDVAAELDVAPSTVSRALRAARFDRVIEAEDAARLMLQNLAHD